MENRPKLFVHEKIEVKDLEEGLHGPWHPATVIGFENQHPTVRFDHILSDDGSTNLIETIHSNRIFGNSINVLIRPLPPPPEFEKSSLNYGRCVDVFHTGAWFEGVIFDRENNSDKRKIFFPDTFFPDTGDELMAQISILRITQDWNGLSDEWKPRQNWLFLELVEEIAKEWPFFVPLKQNWYNVRAKSGFGDIKDWTSSSSSSDKDKWKNLLMEVVSDHFKFICDDVFQELNTSDDLIWEKPKNPFFDLSDYVLNVDFLQGKEEEIPIENKIKKRLERLPAGIDLVPEAENCPNSISEYLKKGGGSKNILKSNARKHLLFLGWKIEYVIDKGMMRFFYTSPEGKQFQSLKQVCLNLMKPKSESESVSPSIVDVEPKSELDVHMVVSEYCPEAVLDYYLMGSYDGKEKGSQARIKAMKAKQHLAAVGWKFYYIWKKDKKELRYCSPVGKVFYSLKTACRSLLEETGNSYCKQFIF